MLIILMYEYIVSICSIIFLPGLQRPRVIFNLNNPLVHLNLARLSLTLFLVSLFIPFIIHFKRQEIRSTEEVKCS